MHDKDTSSVQIIHMYQDGQLSYGKYQYIRYSRKSAKGNAAEKLQNEAGLPCNRFLTIADIHHFEQCMQAQIIITYACMQA